MARLKKTRVQPARTKSKPPTKGPRQDGDTERRILDAAHAVFVRRGTAGARMQEIAAEAGVNQALLHYYFRTKDRLAQAAFQRAASELMPAVIQAPGSDGDLESKAARVLALEPDHLSPATFPSRYLLSKIHPHTQH